MARTNGADKLHVKWTTNDTAKSQTNNNAVGDVSEPVFRGSILDGIDRVAYDLVKAAFV